jgi:hypothetical protein
MPNGVAPSQPNERKIRMSDVDIRRSALDLEKVILLATLDREFREALLTKPEQALAALHIKSTPERVDALRELDRESIKRLGLAFGHPDANQGFIN